MALPDLTAGRVLAALLKIQGRGGYTDEPGTARYRELEAWADVVSQGLVALGDALEQAFPGTLDTLLSETEDALRLPADARLSTAERRSRVRAVRALLGGPRDSIVSSIAAELGVSVVIESVTRTAILSSGSEPERIFWRAVELAAGDFAQADIRDRLLEHLRRLLPARSLPRDPAELAALITDQDAFCTWGSLGTLDRSRLGVSGPVLSTGRPPARLVDYSFGRRIDAADLNAIQAGFVSRAIDSDAAARGTPGGRWLVMVIDIANGATATLDNAQGWTNRLVATCIRSWGTNDYRPGQANDKLGNAGGTEFAGLGYTLSGVKFEVGEWPTSGAPAGLRMYADGVGLKLENATGATWRGIVVVRSTDALKGGSAAVGSSEYQRFTRYGVIGATGPDATFAAEIRNTAWMCRPNAGAAQVQSWPDYAGDGGLRRFGFMVDIPRPELGAQKLVVDASADWRDRILLIEHATSVDTFGAFPGGSDGGFVDTLSPTVFYTGPGGESGSVSDTEWGFPTTLTQPIYLYADQDTGALCVDAYAAGGTWDMKSLALRIHASEQLGFHSTPGAILDLAPSDSALIQPAELNALQDGGLVAQFGGARRPDRSTLTPYLLGPPPLRSASYPMGPIAHGTPRVPLEWLVRDRYGSNPETYYQRRQNVVGTIRQPFAVYLPNNLWTAIPPNNQLRAVDRLVYLYGFVSGFDIRPGQAGETQIGAGNANPVGLLVYTGKGDPAVVWTAAALLSGTALSVRVAAGGYLEVKQASGSDAYVVGVIELSMPVGAWTTY